MNRTMNNKKPFCKVCKDAGKPESEYSSHYVKSLPDKKGNTNVTCPTLLNTECRYCYDIGHTAKFCPVLAAKEKADTRQQARQPAKQPTKQPTKPTENRKGGFAALEDEPDKDFPALCQPSQYVPISGGYAAALAKPAILLPKPVTVGDFMQIKYGMRAEKSQIEKPKYHVTSWANDDTDSEGEDE